MWGKVGIGSTFFAMQRDITPGGSLCYMNTEFLLFDVTTKDETSVVTFQSCTILCVRIPNHCAVFGV